MSEAALWRRMECFRLLGEFSNRLDNMHQGQTPNQISQNLHELAPIMMETSELITMNEEALSRMNNAVLLAEHHEFIINEVARFDPAPPTVTQGINRILDIVVQELREILIGMSELIARSPDPCTETSDFLIFMNETSHEPFLMTNEANSRISNFHQIQEELLTILQEQSQYEGDTASRETIEAHTLQYKYKKYQRENDSEDDEESSCTICIGEFEEDEEARRLPCLHFFHLNCIDGWLRRSTRCPICRTAIDEQNDDFPMDTGECCDNSVSSE